MNSSEIFILISGEESQAICLAFRSLGFQAFSNDLKPCSGGHPEWHYQMDMFDAVRIRKWHFFMVHPVCKYMCVSGLHWNYRVEGRAELTEIALQGVCDILNEAIEIGIECIGLENPIACISTRICKDFLSHRYVVIPLEHKDKYKKIAFKPAQTIQPYNFGEDASKATCLWLIGLPKLKNGIRFPGRITADGKERWSNQTDGGQNKLGPSDDRDELRSKTYPCVASAVASAVAEQWGNYLLLKYGKQ